MFEWNVVVTVYSDDYKRAWHILEDFGRVSKTDYFNVLVLKVPLVEQFLGELSTLAKADASVLNVIARAVPVSETFTFQTPAEFEHQVRRCVAPWVPALADKTFHVRMHRRGFKQRLSSQEEERFVDHFIIGQLREQNASATVSFDDPDVIIAIETVGQRGGVSRWSREQRQAYPFLRLD